MQIFILDSHTIYRRGLAAFLLGMDEVTEVTEADTVEQAQAAPALADTDVLLIDHDLPGGIDFIEHVRGQNGPNVVVCSSLADDDEVMTAIQAGAIGYLSKETLTPDALAAGVRSAAAGSGVMAPELLGSFMEGLSRISRDVLKPRGLSLSPLTAREQQVLTLVAEGHPTREVASRLCYSERTVKNVLHDIVTKLNARTRSQAVAYAVREGLI